jgi:hypothetical protein
VKVTWKSFYLEDGHNKDPRNNINRAKFYMVRDMRMHTQKYTTKPGPKSALKCHESLNLPQKSITAITSMNMSIGYQKWYLRITRRSE